MREKERLETEAERARVRRETQRAERDRRLKTLKTMSSVASPDPPAVEEEEEEEVAMPPTTMAPVAPQTSLFSAGAFGVFSKAVSHIAVEREYNPFGYEATQAQHNAGASNLHALFWGPMGS